MPRKPIVLTTLALATSLCLAGCSGTKEEPVVEVATNVDCSTLTIDSDAPALPTISDVRGAEPTVEWSGKKAPENLTVKILQEGDGAEVAAGAQVTVNYSGWQWDSSTAFESSFSKGAPPSFSVDGVITGWRCALPGKHVGDRLLLSIPAQYAYGTDRSSGKPTGTLVFVVEIEGTESLEEVNAGTKDAVPEGDQQVADRGLTVSGELGAPATVSVNDGAVAPTENEFIVLARGNGEAITENSVVLIQTAGSSWDNLETFSTWEEKQPMRISAGSDPALKGIIGLPVGSRVLVLIPGDAESETPALAQVIDLERLD
ncbi:FKBP-type peptidyl-prolyl cis-trans isomerase [Actinomyces weissii]|uniref:Peptidyl-prolyl cis-trans isomerase n=1 Tax=Actinomyces weissii TaxID=675090 RepID=A0A7T7M908_9ACTO|nr:FKBP-type peptidyl-prolyl cis-trans isomerase [Actinomyces weissii]QQM66647.1 FKBP-type peptidyl-prolyl cis-trans isomerase [Actinomyces weissii]